MFAELLDTDAPIDPARQRKFVQVIQTEASRLTRLLDNVLDFGRLEQNRHTPKLRPTDIPEAVRIVVSDRGPGIPAGCEERIFEQFFRAHDSLASGIPGSGLGLALARRLVDLHRGTLVGTSRPEGGTRFVVTLPRVTAQPTP